MNLTGARAALFALLVGFCAFAFAGEALDLGRAEALVRQGRAAEAYALLERFEFEQSGDTNFDYWLGVSALESGRPDRATLALERALIVNPDFLGARLDLARAYFALGDMQRARQEFDLVLAQNPPLPARATIDRYLAEIERRTETARTRWSAYLETTAGRDSNVNNATSRSNVFVPLFGLELVLTPQSVKIGDWYGSFGAGGEITQHVVGGLAAFAGADYRLRANWRQDNFDFTQLDGRVGLQYQLDRQLFRVGVNAGEYRLDSRRHYENTGYAGEWRYAVREDTVASFFGASNRLRYHDPLLRGNSADQLLVGIGLLHSFNPDRTTYVFASVYGGHERDTDNRIDGARDLWGVRLTGQYNILPNLDIFAVIGGHMSDYDTPNFVFQNVRRDRLYEASLGFNWRPERGWTVRPQVSYVSAYSNIPINKFNRYDVSITLRRDFR
jgi:tetratricopeptide (TPR) repeat protein